MWRSVEPDWYASSQLCRRIIQPVTRRRALLLATIAVGSTGFAVMRFGTVRPTGLAERRLHPSETLDPTAPTGALSSQERATLLALASLVLPSASDRHQAFTSAYVDAQARTVPGALAAYRSAVALLDDRSGGRFTARSADAQLATLERILPSYAGRDRLARWRARLLRAESDRRLHELVVRDLVAAFYRSPEGWRRAGHPRGYGEPAPHPLAYADAGEGRA